MMIYVPIQYKMSNQIYVLVIVVVLLYTVPESNCQLQVYTPNDQAVAVPLSSHGFDISNTTVLKFQVKACANAHVIIQKTAAPNLYSAPNYAFVLGSSSNTFISIKDTVHGSYLTYTSAVVLSCDESNAFWISWTNGVLKLGRGTVEYADELLSTNKGPLSGYKYAFLLTGWGSYGCWNIDIGPVPVSVTYNRFKHIYTDTKLQASGLLNFKTKSKLGCSIRCSQPQQSQCGCQKFSYNSVTGDCLIDAMDIVSTLVNYPGWVTGYL